MLNETNASLAGIADSINWNLIAIIVSIILFILGAIINHYYKMREEKKDKRTARIADINNLINNFYVPLQNALRTFNIEKVLANIHTLKNLGQDNNNEAFNLINETINRWQDFKDNYIVFISHRNLASDETMEHLTRFIDIFECNDLFKNRLSDFRRLSGIGRRYAYDSETLHYFYNRGCFEQYKHDSVKLSEYYYMLESLVNNDIANLNTELAGLVNL